MKKILPSVMILLAVIPLTMLTVFRPATTVATEAEINDAIDLGMQWLVDSQNSNGSWGIEAQVGKTGFAVLIFETHAVAIEEDSLDPTYEYYDQVRNGLDYIFANASIMPISVQPSGDPDTDGDGFGVCFGLAFRTYETGIAMMAIAASTHPEMVVDVPGSSVDGWTYEAVLQDAVDYLAFGQTDAGNGTGGWAYEENIDDWSDNSNTGYAVLGLAYAEASSLYGFGLTIPEFAKSELNVWIDYIQNDPGPLDDGFEIDPDGGSGYVAPDEWVNILKTGHLLSEMAFVGDTRATQRVIDAVDYVVRHWNDTDVDPGWKGSPAENASYQAMYTTMTGLEALGIDEIDGIDWFDGFSDVLVAEQNPDGSWPPCIWDDGEQILATEWALLILQKVAPPIPIDGWPMFHHDLSHTGYSTSKAPNTNNTIWSYTTGDFVLSSSAVVDGKVYVGSRDNKTYCLNASTGDFIWNYTTGGYVWSSSAVVDGKVYVGSRDNKTYCLNASTGDFIWNYTTGGYVSSSPAVADGEVYVASHDGKVYCLNASTGDLIWDFLTGGGFSSPAIADGRVYVGSWDNNVYCLNATTGAHIWNYTTGYTVWSSPAVVDGRVYVGSSDRNVYCLNATTGAHIWNYVTGGPVSSSPAVADGKVYVGSDDRNVYCLNATTGAHIWNYTTGSVLYVSSPAVADGKVYVGSRDNKTYCLNASTGDFIWNYVTGGPVSSSPAVADGKVYVGSGDSNVYAFGPPPTHDVAATNVRPSKTVVGQGYCMNITVTVENQGGLTETFNVTAYYGNDTITPAQWETFWSWGDVNRDGYINQTDVDIINSAWGSIPGDPNWCPWADLNQDLVVDLGDIMIVTLHWWWNIWTHLISGAVIETQTVNNLPTGTSTTLVFTWNTTGVAQSNYTISAYAVPILYEEIDRADNNYGNGVVKVTIPGDDDGDGDVDASDLFDLSKAYGSEPGDDNWNPNCDLNNDGKVDASDLFDQSRNYGKMI